MENQNYIYLNRKAVLAAMITAAFPVGAHAAAGKVEFASGGATIQGADGSSKVMTKGMEINQGDTILTGAGRAQVKFSDGGYISFQPNTQFKIEEYNYNGKQDGSERGFFRLVQGGLRALTGFVGRENRPNYRMATPVATIGIRGSYYLAEFQEKLKTHVGHGSIYVFNDQGNIILFEGQGATVESGKAPGYSDQEMTLGARGPQGGQPSETKDEQQASSENSDVFKVSEQYGGDGTSQSITNSDNGMSAIITNLNGMNAQGYYSLDTSAGALNGGGGGNGTYAYSTYLASGPVLHINFGSYSVDGQLNVQGTQTYTPTSGSGFSTPIFSTYLSFSGGPGSLLQNGSFSATGGGSGSICYTSCSVNVVGFASGAQAEKASIGYVINGVNDGNGGGTVKIGGAADLKANPPPGSPPL